MAKNLLVKIGKKIMNNKLLITGIILAILVILIIIIRNYNITKYRDLNIKKYDIILVGAGVGNAYLSYLLKEKYPKLKILVIEKTNRKGGRLLSMESDGDSATDDYVKDELGAMRIFKVDAMKELINLISKLGLQLQPVGIYY